MRRNKSLKTRVESKTKWPFDLQHLGEGQWEKAGKEDRIYSDCQMTCVLSVLASRWFWSKDKSKEKPSSTAHINMTLTLGGKNLSNEAQI